MKHPSSLLGVVGGFLFLALGSQASAQTTWYVDVNGVPPGSGTAADPYTQIQYGITRPTTLNGDTLLVAPGTYVENLQDYPKWVNVVSSGGPLVTELRPLIANYATVYWESGSSIEGFTLTGNTSNHLNGCALNLADSLAVNCIVRDNPGRGVFSYNGQLIGCTIRDGINVEFFSVVQLRDSIVWPKGILPSAFPPVASYCAGLLPQDAIGTGNLPGDPGLWTLAGSRHLLQPGSPCIDAGDPNSPLDPDGTRADIGAVPFDPSYAPPAVTYCAGKQNSQGCVPAIGSSGSARATPGTPFTITAVNEVDGKAGLLFFGFGSRAQPFQGGWHCIQLPTKRVGAQNSGGSGPCTGTYAFDMGGYIGSGAHPGLVAGAEVYCQWWSRDPLDGSGFGTGLSNALCFGIAP